MSGTASECLICGATVQPGVRSADAFLVDRFLDGVKLGRLRPQRLRPTPCRRHIMEQTQSKADIEYAVMLATLNFHTEFMRSNYSHVAVDMMEDVIDVTLTRSVAVPAEERLAQSEAGRDLLRQVHEAMMRACQDMLKERIERVVGRRVREIVASLDPIAGQSHLAIRLEEAATSGVHATAYAGASSKV
ncbi:MAG: DUF2294 family protein [Nitrospiraceae bacterium]|nr:DUF2294 family protein [Nitrospiraceae bacterium]